MNIVLVAAHSYELNNLDNEALDAPVYNAIPGTIINHQYGDDSNQDFASLPCETFLVACRTENDLLPGGDSFRHKNPMYQSAHVQLASATDDNGSDTDKKDGNAYEYIQYMKKSIRLFYNNNHSLLDNS